MTKKKKPSKHRTGWSSYDIDRVVLWTYEGRDGQWIGARMGRTAQAVKNLSCTLREAGESFVTQEMRKLAGESEKDHRDRLDLARQEVELRRARLPERKGRSLDDEPAALPNGEIEMEIVFRVNGHEAKVISVDPAVWARTLGHFEEQKAK